MSTRRRMVSCRAATLVSLAQSAAVMRCSAGPWRRRSACGCGSRPVTTTATPPRRLWRNARSHGVRRPTLQRCPQVHRLGPTRSRSRSRSQRSRLCLNSSTTSQPTRRHDGPHGPGRSRMTPPMARWTSASSTDGASSTATLRLARPSSTRRRRRGSWPRGGSVMVARPSGCGMMPLPSGTSSRSSSPPTPFPSAGRTATASVTSSQRRLSLRPTTNG